MVILGSPGLQRPAMRSGPAHLVIPCGLVPLLLQLAVVGMLAATATADPHYITPNITKNYKKNLTVGYLTAIKGDLKERQGLTISGAITYALDEVNNDPNLLPDVNLVLKWNDTRGDTVVATHAITEMICDGVVAFFGPEGTCFVEATVAQSRNVPMISYKCSDYKASNVPTFARTEPPVTQVIKSLLALLRYYSWRKFTILYEEAWQNVAWFLQSEAGKIQNNMTVNDIKEVLDRHKCCEKKLPCCQSGYWYEIIQSTKDRTRIYVFLGTPTTLIDLMSTMQTAQLFDNGEFMVIYVDMNTYSDREARKYLWRPDDFTKNTTCFQLQKDFLKRAQSLLVVASTPPTPMYENFTEKVRMYNSKEPFNFPKTTLFNIQKYQKFVSIYAAYLYDSVYLYAKALHNLLYQNQTQPITPELIDEVASNGMKIIEAIIGMKNYSSVLGTTMHIDNNGDSAGNFSVLALNENSFQVGNFKCSYQMVPVATFHAGGKDDNILDYKLKLSKQVTWPGGYKPEDEPSCGFNNESCPKSDTHL